MGFPGGSAVKNSPANAGDTVSIPGLGRSLEKGMATHSSMLALTMNSEPGGLQSHVPVHGVTKGSDTT